MHKAREVYHVTWGFPFPSMYCEVELSIFCHVLLYTVLSNIQFLLVHLSRRFTCTIVITRCPSLTFHIFDFFSETAERNSTKLDRTGSKISTSSTKFAFFGPIGKKQDGHPGLWLAETFSTSPLKPLSGIQRNLTAIKILNNVLYHVCVFRADRKSPCIRK